MNALPDARKRAWADLDVDILDNFYATKRFACNDISMGLRQLRVPVSWEPGEHPGEVRPSAEGGEGVADQEVSCTEDGYDSPWVRAACPRSPFAVAASGGGTAAGGASPRGAPGSHARHERLPQGSPSSGPALGAVGAGTGPEREPEPVTPARAALKGGAAATAGAHHRSAAPARLARVPALARPGSGSADLGELSSSREASFRVWGADAEAAAALTGPSGRPHATPSFGPYREGPDVLDSPCLPSQSCSEASMGAPGFPGSPRSYAGSPTLASVETRRHPAFGRAPAPVASAPTPPLAALSTPTSACAAAHQRQALWDAAATPYPPTLAPSLSSGASTPRSGAAPSAAVPCASPRSSALRDTAAPLLAPPPSTRGRCALFRALRLDERQTRSPSDTPTDAGGLRRAALLRSSSMRRGGAFGPFCGRTLSFSSDEIAAVERGGVAGATRPEASRPPHRARAESPGYSDMDD